MSDIIKNGVNTLKIESDALLTAAKRLDDNFVKAVNLILNCKGRVVVTGMGKSGHICQKLAATLSSTGTPSFFLHPAEGVHGDLGMLVKGDVVIAISYSGETEEVIRIIPIIKRLSLPLISITGDVRSSLASKSDAVIDGSIDREACPMNLAPTTSTTLALALGDALAVALVEEKGFKAEDFAIVHPMGSLGKKLLLTIKDIWHTGKDVPIVTKNTPLKDLLYIISSKGFGCAAVVNDEGSLIGIVTDGDLRRGMERESDMSKITVEKVMSSNPKRIDSEALAVEAMGLMEKHSITSLISVNESGKPVGIIHLHDLLKTGIR